LIGGVDRAKEHGPPHHIPARTLNAFVETTLRCGYGLEPLDEYEPAPDASQ